MRLYTRYPLIIHEESDGVSPEDLLLLLLHFAFKGFSSPLSLIARPRPEYL